MPSALPEEDEGQPLGLTEPKGVGFRDPRHEQAETLFDIDQPQLGPLTRLLEYKLREVVARASTTSASSRCSRRCTDLSMSSGRSNHW
jgi:hypothetical protein